MNSTVSDYRLRIDQLDNGYTITIDNNNGASRVFEKLEDVLEYVKQFFDRGEKTRQ